MTESLLWETAASGFIAAPHVLHSKIGDEILILDLRRGRYSLLDRTASLMWMSLIRGREGELACELAQRHDLPCARLADDISCFAKSCSAIGWLMSAASAIPELPTKTARRRFWSGRWLVAKALFSMLATSARMLRGDLFSAIQSSYGLAESVELFLPLIEAEEFLRQAEDAFVTAENIYRFNSSPDDCLPRSLALYTYLRRLGLPVEHRIGAQASPIQMHAWVEFNGRALLKDRTGDYAPFVKPR